MASILKTDNNVSNFLIREQWGDLNFCRADATVNLTTAGEAFEVGEVVMQVGGKADGTASGLLEYLSMLRHFESFSKGVFNSSDFIYYILFISLFLILSIRRLDGDRLQR